MSKLKPSLLKTMLNLPQTSVLMIGTITGYIIFVFIHGLRGIVIGLGGIITFIISMNWILKVQEFQKKMNRKKNILQSEIFEYEFKKLEKKLAGKSSPSWEQVYQWTWEIYHFSQQISSHEPELIPDLIEALYTVLNLVEQSVMAFLTLQKVQTEAYKNLAQNHLKMSYQRLQTTHQQLQQLCDQVVLAQLPDTELAATEKSLPKRLKILIAENKTAIEPNQIL